MVRNVPAGMCTPSRSRSVAAIWAVAVVLGAHRRTSSTAAAARSGRWTSSAHWSDQRFDAPMVTVAPSMSKLVRPENSFTSCDLRILVHEAAEPIPPQRPDRRRTRAWGSAVFGRVLVERSVWSVSVSCSRYPCSATAIALQRGGGPVIRRWSRHSRRSVTPVRCWVRRARAWYPGSALDNAYELNELLVYVDDDRGGRADVWRCGVSWNPIAFFTRVRTVVSTFVTGKRSMR